MEQLKCAVCHRRDGLTEAEIGREKMHLCGYCGGLYVASRYRAWETATDVLNDLWMEVAYTRLADLRDANDRENG